MENEVKSLSIWHFKLTFDTISTIFSHLKFQLQKPLTADPYNVECKEVSLTLLPIFFFKESINYYWACLPLKPEEYKKKTEKKLTEAKNLSIPQIAVY